MRNKKIKKLSLDKIKIAQLDHLDKFKGGLGTAPNSTDPQICNTHPLLCELSVSTKTLPVGSDGIP
ncbi:hypothetical protein [uncultured Aquimarina sp.]|uniref:hypothetical protein n=1 Tax=uncultured Aquimarina sp. TaxID=575652 RepID=UPI002618BFB2|nr:hypothetical protein [uncultured Aquimarina sp.]